MSWEPIKEMFPRKLSARDKNICPDCGAELEQCDAQDIASEYSVQPGWARAVTVAKRCVVGDCGFYYMHIGPSGFYMKPYGGRGWQHFDGLPEERGEAEMKFSGCTGRVWQDDKFWLVEVDAVDVMTQGHNRGEALVMIGDAIEGHVNNEGFSATTKEIDAEHFALMVNDVEVFQAWVEGRTGKKPNVGSSFDSFLEDE